MHLHEYIIISQNKQDNSRLCTILDYHSPKICCRHCYKTLPHLTINTTSSKSLLSYYLANKKSLLIRSQGLNIPTLIGEKEKLKFSTTAITKKLA